MGRFPWLVIPRERGSSGGPKLHTEREIRRTDDPSQRPWCPGVTLALRHEGRLAELGCMACRQHCDKKAIRRSKSETLVPSAHEPRYKQRAEEHPRVKAQAIEGPHGRQGKRQHINQEGQRTEQGSQRERQSGRRRSAHEQSHKGRDNAHEPRHTQRRSPTSSRARGSTATKTVIARGRRAAESGGAKVSTTPTGRHTRGTRAPIGGASSAVRAQCNYLGVWPY